MTNPAEKQEPTDDGAPRFLLKGQYIKDLSFESPHAPMSLLSLREPPKVDMNVNLGAQRVQESLYELSMSIAVRAIGERTLFLADLIYAGLFELHNIPEDKIEQLVLVDCAFILYPFARRVIADVTRDGAFPPLLLEPIDFYRLYAENRSKAPA